MKGLSGASIRLALALLFLLTPIAAPHPAHGGGDPTPTTTGWIQVSCGSDGEDLLAWTETRGISLLVGNQNITAQHCGSTLSNLTLTLPPITGFTPWNAPAPPNVTLVLHLSPGQIVISPNNTTVTLAYCEEPLTPLRLYYLKVNASLPEGAQVTLIRNVGEEPLTLTFHYPSSLLAEAHRRKGYTPLPPAECNGALPQLIGPGDTYILRAETPEGPLIAVGTPIETPVNTTLKVNDTAVQGEETLEPTVTPPPEPREDGGSPPPPVLKGEGGEVDAPPRSPVSGETVINPRGVARVLLVIGLLLIIVGLLGVRGRRG